MSTVFFINSFLLLSSYPIREVFVEKLDGVDILPYLDFFLWVLRILLKLALDSIYERLVVPEVFLKKDL